MWEGSYKGVSGVSGCFFGSEAVLGSEKNERNGKSTVDLSLVFVCGL